MSRRNGKIEILRFFFCMAVLFFHIGSDALGGDKELSPHFSFFALGRTGVEFFFLVSGFLAAKSAYKVKNKDITIGQDTFNFIFRKIKSILPYHIFAVLLAVVLIFSYSDDFLNDIFKRLPSLFFLQRTGIYGLDFISVEWYICSMLLALAIAYPMMRKNFHLSTLVVFPIVSSLLIGYMSKTYGMMPLTNDFSVFTYSCNLRAIAVVFLSCFSFAICEKIKKHKFTTFQNALLVVVENLCWLISVYFVTSNMSARYDTYITYFMAVAITLTFRREFNCKIYNNRFVNYLGKLSLPVYLCQNVARDIVRNEFDYLSSVQKILFTAFLAVIIGVIAKAVCDALLNKIKNKNDKNNRKNKGKKVYLLNNS